VKKKEETSQEKLNLIKPEKHKEVPQLVEGVVLNPAPSLIKQTGNWQEHHSTSRSTRLQ
jgi:predicted nucleic acid binding AN1-type Zn finger protein